MRSEKSIRNVLFAWGMQIVILALGLVSRTIFIEILGEEILGVGGLFTSILSMLSLAELGIGTAIVFSLYKPIAENNREQMIALMGFYRRFYQAVGCFVLLAGAALTPFLSFFFNKTINVDHLQIVYLLYVVNAGVSYFFAYKASYINANQDNFLVSLNHGICNCVMMIFQMIFLILTHNFIVYLIVQIVMTLVENFIISYIADRRYPLLKSKEKYKIEPATIQQIKKNTLAMVGHNVGTIVMNSTDNIIITKFVGVVESALYSNYFLIITSLNTILNQAFAAVTGSVGNLMVVGEEKQKEDTLYMIFFANFWIYGFSGIALFCLFNPFITVWIGKKYLFAMPIVAVLSAKFYCTGIRMTCITFKNAAGLYMQDVYKPYIEVILNLVISLILVEKTGIFGVFLGTLITTLLVATWIEPMVLFRCVFHKNPWKYFGKYLWYGVVVIATAIVTYGIGSLIHDEGILGFILKMFLTAVIPNLIFLVLFFRTKEFGMLTDIMKNIVKNRRCNE